MFCLDPNHFGRKGMHTHVLSLEILVVFEDPIHQSMTSQAFVRYFPGLSFLAEIFHANMWTLLELTYMAPFLFHPSLVHYQPA